MRQQFQTPASWAERTRVARLPDRTTDALAPARGLLTAAVAGSLIWAIIVMGARAAFGHLP